MKVRKRKFGGIVSIIVVLVMIAGVVVAAAYQDRLVPGNSYDERYVQNGNNQRPLPDYRYHAYDGSHPRPWVGDHHRYRGDTGYHGWCHNCCHGYGCGHYHYRPYGW